MESALRARSWSGQLATVCRYGQCCPIHHRRWQCWRYCSVETTSCPLSFHPRVSLPRQVLLVGKAIRPTLTRGGLLCSHAYAWEAFAHRPLNCLNLLASMFLGSHWLCARVECWSLSYLSRSLACRLQKGTLHWMVARYSSLNLRPYSADFSVANQNWARPESCYRWITYFSVDLPKCHVLACVAAWF